MLYIKVTFNHIVYLEIEADYIDLKVGKVYSGIITHIIFNKKLVVKIENLIIVFE